MNVMKYKPRFINSKLLDGHRQCRFVLTLGFAVFAGILTAGSTTSVEMGHSITPELFSHATLGEGDDANRRDTTKLVKKVFHEIGQIFTKHKKHNAGDSTKVAVQGPDSTKNEASKDSANVHIVSKPTVEVYGWTYAGSSRYENLQLDILSSVAVSFGLKTNGNGYSTSSWNFEGFEDLVKRADSNKCGVEISMLYNMRNQPGLFSNATNLESLSDELVQYVDSFKIAGVNLDLEGTSSEQKGDLYSFIKMLSGKLKEKGARLTTTVPSVDSYEIFQPEALDDYIDRYIIMGYEYFGTHLAGPVAPLNPSVWNETYNIASSTEYYLSTAKINPGKIILALPTYGAIWSLDVPYSDPANNHMANAKRLDEVSYSRLRQLYPSLEEKDKLDSLSTTQYLEYKKEGDENEYIQVWFDGLESLPHKIDYALSKNLAGFGIWNLDYLNGDMWAMMRDTLVTKPMVDHEVEIAETDLNQSESRLASEIMALRSLVEKDKSLLLFVASIIIFFLLIGVVLALRDQDVRAILIEKVSAYIPFLNTDKP